MVLKLVLSFLLAAPVLAWGRSSYLSQVQDQKLWEDPQWIKLGHYRKKWFGAYQSPLQGNFFISPHGDTDPKAELLATVNLLFGQDETSKKSQCRYLARMSWLKKRLDIDPQDIAPCPERDQWKKQLGAQELYIIFASSDLNSAGSSFGHTFLRAHNPQNTKEKELLDYGINYAAITGDDGGALYALKGLFGFYPGAYSMLPYYQKIREYTNMEGRNIWEYRLNFSPAEVEFLIDHLLELDGSYAPYYFADDNCSQQILELLEVAKPQLDLASSFHDFTIPLDTVKVLNQHHLLSGEKMRPSLQSEWRARYTALNAQEKKALKKVLKSTEPSAIADLDKKAQAEVLEASLSYLAIKEYREQKECKEEKYRLSVARAQLGAQTAPLQLEIPPSPLTSHDSQAFYLGYGKNDDFEFYRFKYRRAFHDLLSDDSSLSPFSHLEVLSFDFRYFTEKQNLDLYRFILLKIISTAPVNILDTPVSWKLDIGTEPRLSPFVNIGAGLSFDFFRDTRFTVLALSENYELVDTAQPYLGGEALFMMKHSGWRAFIGGKYLSSTTDGHHFPEYNAGLSTNISTVEIRGEYRQRDDVPEWMLSVVF